MFRFLFIFSFFIIFLFFFLFSFISLFSFLGDGGGPSTGALGPGS